MKINNFCIANWKMNLDVDECLNFLKKFNSFKNVHAGTKVVICPSYTSIYPCINNDNTFGLSWGAQDISNNLNGAFTGEVSLDMVEKLGCEYTIVGHSERRANFNETNDIVAEKFIKIYNSSLTPILCIGESFNDRNNGNFKNVLTSQIDNALSKLSIIDKNIIIAYEPIWAIGTGVSADLKTISETHSLLKNIIKKYTLKNCNIWLLYGGSVNDDNSKSIISLENVDGFLIGGASLSPEKFYKIYTSMGGL